MIVGGAAALSVDPTREGYGLKGDEATYVSMALSLAHDRDVRFDRRDLQRFWAIYGTGPEGLFLKRGGPLVPRVRAAWPVLTLERAPERTRERLYYAKAFVYGAAAAPFAAVWGINGLLLLNVLLLAGVVLAGYTFLAARGTPVAAILFSTAFVFASCAPVYGVWLTPEILNLALVFFGYFLWLYKEVAPAASSRWTQWLRSPLTDVAAAALLALATYSKPPNILLVVPIVVWLLWRRRVLAGLMIGAVFGAVVAGAFALTALVAGDANYQGGERKTFYGTFPFQSRALTFETSGVSMATDELVGDDPFEPGVFWPRLAANARYFFVGRHFGFLPYFFPGVIALGLFVVSRRKGPPWRWAVLAVTCATALWFLVMLPFSWSGGGGPIGNRYFLSVYPALFFVVPSIRSWWPGVLAWAGGAAFIAHILVQPFYAARFPWITSQRGLLRALPVELTMPDDLPIRLTLERSRLDYGDPRMLLYLVTEEAYQPEPAGIWIKGGGRADVLVRSAQYGDLRARLVSPIANVVRVGAGRGSRLVHLTPGVPVDVTLPVRWVQSRPGSAAFLLSVQATHGFVPRLIDPAATDGRWLGVQISFEVVSPKTGESGSE